MDLTPQLFRDVQFTERRGAYDRDEVNAFLARVGTAVGQLQERVREAKLRVDAAEERAARLEAKAGEQVDAKETMQRMIETATRFAAEAEKEAKDNAEAVVAQARKKADDLIRQAEEAVRRDVGATRDRLEAEIRQLERHRDELKERIDGLDAHLERERVRLRGQLDEMIAALDDPQRLVVATPAGTDPEPIIVLTDPSRPEATLASPDTTDDDLSDLPPPPEDWEPGTVADRAGFEPAGPATEATPALFEDESRDDAAPEDATPGDAGADPGHDDGGPPTEAHPVVGPGTAFGGNHLEELRRAVSDDAPDAEADAAMAAFFDQDTDDDEPSRRFGRRR
jgi:DivIVA domain-containing protein